ncbi:MAG: hypothetical protein CMO81_02115 [Waddliaceae bacterium]|nr:hypothetical protein [Waddliaceae bacterium]
MMGGCFRFVCALVFTVIIFLPLSLSAEEKTYITKPKSIITLPYHLHNSGDSEWRVEFDLDLPEGWGLLSPLSPITLAPNQSRKRLIHVQVPLNAQAEIPYQLTLHAQGNRVEEVVWNVQVEAIHHFTVSDIPSFHRIWNGEIIHLPVSITNHGNTPQSYRIQVRTIDDWKVWSPELIGPLAPLEKAVVDIRIQAPLKQKTGQNSLTVIIDPVSSQAGASIARYSTMQIISKNAHKESLYKTLPATFESKFHEIEEGLFPKTRLKFSSSGSLNEHIDIDLFAKGTYFGAEESGLAARKQEFLLELHDDRGWETSVGNTYALFSRLADDLYGNGIRLSGAYNSLYSQAFYGKHEFFNEENIEEYPFGVDLVWQYSKKGTMGSIYQNLRQDFQSTPLPSSTPILENWELASFFIDQEIGDYLALYGELGYSRTKRDSNEYDAHGYFLEASFHPGKWTFLSELRFANTEFAGRIHDEEAYRFYVDYQLSHNIHSWLHYEHEKDNSDKNPSLPRQTRAQYELASYFTLQSYWPTLIVSGNFEKIYNDEVIKTEDKRKKYLQVLLNKSWLPYQFFLRGRWGKDEDFVLSTESYSSSYLSSLYSFWDPFSLQLKSEYTEALLNRGIQRTVNGECIFTQDMKTWGVWSARGGQELTYLLPKEKQTISKYELNYYHNWERFTIDLRYRHKRRHSSLGTDFGAPRERSFLARFRYLPSSTDTFTLYLEADQPKGTASDGRIVLVWKHLFGIPLPVKKPQGRIQGTLRAENLILPRTRLRIGTHEVYTDQNGSFSFPLLSPGEYTIELNDPLLPAELYIENKNTLKVDLEAGKDHYLNLQLARKKVEAIKQAPVEEEKQEKRKVNVIRFEQQKVLF